MQTRSLTTEQQELYKRNILLAGVGVAGQEKLLNSGVLVVGAGGLGSPVAFYLAAAGVGRIGLIDNDTVGLSNLQRQILHALPDLGRPKIISAAEKLKALNPDLVLELYQKLFDADTAADLVPNYDIVIDCTDNFPARHVINKACLRAGKPFVYGGVLAWAGQTFTVLPGRGPCLRCIFRDDPPPSAPSTTELGILGAVPGVIGVLQASEAIRYILGTGELLVGRMLIYDALSATFCEVALERDSDCPSCGSLDGN
ncbi:MAG: HesA/MoeB/ThiF family protein [Desulfotomaculaceae bacterium]|nr:HesA/MoeB/ThiF family protein [Desulfotomaculaceae bacterium]